MIGGVTGVVVPQHFAALHQERARHLPFVASWHADAVASEQGAKSTPPSYRAEDLHERS